ncbi:GGDEF domain-containing protein [Aliiglaciecola sp. LCG003]|uniref:GGDEF domain-containing protein n=1 Tax=Aliiglaciecola sp. LCG003 TaxID=3053655 RepID=UPI0025748CA6|nr:GGDEF domain-containing protein [Aliiglaciecola sp. LCG003]WJG11305.1 GGDEF domain-containing protein [Aliiglaciecola sp. LCG003]
MVLNFNNLLKNHLHSGNNTSQTYEVNQQIFVVNLFSLIGLIVTFILSMSALYRDEKVLSSLLLVAAIVFLIAHQIHRIKSITHPYIVSRRIIHYCLLALMISVVYTGGYANTGPLWIYIVPPFAFFFAGLKKGLVNIGVFISIISIMLFFPNELLLQASYSYEFKSRLIYSFLTVTFLFGVYEYTRHRSFEMMQQLSDRFEQQAMHDPLTLLPNRRAMREYLDYEFNRAQRSKVDMSVLLCDIDHFKAINDNFGHDGGDSVLQQLANLFTQTLRKQDKIARWGGEEFLLLLPETNAHDAFTLAEKIRLKVADSVFIHDGKEITMTLSIGVNEVTPNTSIDKAIGLADHFLYQAKEGGRNRTMPSRDKLASH